jgi:hypothetical protein
METKQETVRRGWVLKKGNEYWGLVHPEDSSHGGNCAIYGWVTDITKVQMSDREKKPKSKSYFVNPCDVDDVVETSKGEWVLVEFKTEYTLTEWE